MVKTKLISILVLCVISCTICCAQQEVQELLFENICSCIRNIDTKNHNLQEIDVMMNHCIQSNILSNEGKIVFGYSNEDINEEIVKTNISNWEQMIATELMNFDDIKALLMTIVRLNYDTQVYKTEGVLKHVDSKNIYIQTGQKLDTFSIVKYKINSFFRVEEALKKRNQRVVFEYKKETFLNGKRRKSIQSLNIIGNYVKLFSRGSDNLVAEKLAVNAESSTVESIDFNIARQYKSSKSFVERMKVRKIEIENGFLMKYYLANNIRDFDDNKIPTFKKTDYTLKFFIDSTANQIYVEEDFLIEKLMHLISEEEFIKRDCIWEMNSISSLENLALIYYFSLEEYEYILSNLNSSWFSERDQGNYKRNTEKYNAIMSDLGGCLFDEAKHFEQRLNQKEKKSARLFLDDTLVYHFVHTYFSKKLYFTRTSPNDLTLHFQIKDDIEGNYYLSDYKQSFIKKESSDSLVIDVFSKESLPVKLASYTIDFTTGVLTEKLSTWFSYSFPNFKPRKIKITNTFELTAKQLEFRVAALSTTIDEWYRYCNLTLPKNSEEIANNFDEYLYAKSLEDIFKKLFIFYQYSVESILDANGTK